MSDTMSNFTGAYSDVLDTGREKMNEGDYLKLAQFLSSLYKTKEQSEILSEFDILINIKVEFKTNKGKSYDIKIDKCHKIVYRDPKPNDFILYGSINGEEFIMDKKKLANKFRKILIMYGMKEICQTLEDNEPLEFKTFNKFKTHSMEVDKLINYDSDEDEEIECDEYPVDWYITCLFGITYDNIEATGNY